MCGLDDFADVQVYDWVRARKERVCSGCREKIRERDLYHRAKFLSDGAWSLYDHCPRCWAVCEALWKEFPGLAVDMDLHCGGVGRPPSRGCGPGLRDAGRDAGPGQSAILPGRRRKAGASRLKIGRGPHVVPSRGRSENLPIPVARS